jgi:hypothetical protein
VDDYASAVDDRLQSGQSKIVQSLPDGLGNDVGLENGFGFAERRQFRAYGPHYQWPRQRAISHRLEQRIYAGDGA